MRLTLRHRERGLARLHYRDVIAHRRWTALKPRWRKAKDIFWARRSIIPGVERSLEYGFSNAVTDPRDFSPEVDEPLGVLERWIEDVERAEAQEAVDISANQSLYGFNADGTLNGNHLLRAQWGLGVYWAPPVPQEVTASV